MKTTKSLRSKRVLVPAAVLAVAGIGGGAFLATAYAGDNVNGSERDRVAEAAVAAVGGEVTDVETSDDPGEAYDVDLRLEDGSEVDLTLDDQLAVVSEDRDRDDRDDRDRDDRDDRVLDAAETDRVAEAALAETGDGVVSDVEAGDDAGAAYDVDVVLRDGTRVELVLDDQLAVVSREDSSRRQDRALETSEVERAERAALVEVGSGIVTDVEASDDRGVTYEVDLVDDDGLEWDVELDADFAVVDARSDRR